MEAGADLTAVDRFGNHVEDLRAGMVGAGTATSYGTTSLASTGSASKLCDVSYDDPDVDVLSLRRVCVCACVGCVES